MPYTLESLAEMLAQTADRLLRMADHVEALPIGDDSFREELAKARYVGDLLDKRQKALRALSGTVEQIEMAETVRQAEATAREIEERRQGLRDVAAFKQLDLHLETN